MARLFVGVFNIFRRSGICLEILGPNCLFYGIWTFLAPRLILRGAMGTTLQTY